MTFFVPGYIKDAVDRGIGETTRRVEVYESDGKQLWRDGLVDRLIEGNVNVSYGDAERRTLDITLMNEDNLLRSTPEGFWYDKVFKVYRGVKLNSVYAVPSVAVIETPTVALGSRFTAWVTQLGLSDSKQLSESSVSYGGLSNYDIIISASLQNVSAHGPLLAELFNAGRSIITFSNRATTVQVPHIGNSTTKTSTWGIAPPAASTPLGAGWTTSPATSSLPGTGVTSLQGGALEVARWTLSDSTVGITASVATNQNGARWAHVHLPNNYSGTNANVNRLMANLIAWIKEAGSNNSWEAQIGEFGIDGISSPSFPSVVKVTGRDYTKKCMNSKIESAMTFDSGTTTEALIKALAANAGITKFRLSSMQETLGSTISFDRGTPRWEIMQQAAKTQGYEMYFDNNGYLTTRKYLDPTLSPENHLFQTGSDGNLVSIDRNVNDTRIYNHIAVYGDPGSGETRLPYFGEAKNENPASPTRISKIGDRYYSFASTFFTNQAQTQAYAQRLLNLHALESFELSFGAITYPWMEVGEIARVLDPNAVETDPDKYLVDSATIPLALGPMSFTGKRVTIVG